MTPKTSIKSRKEAPIKPAKKAAAASEEKRVADAKKPTPEVPAETVKRPKKGAAQEGKMSGLDAAAKVLADAGEPMKVSAVVDKAIAKGLWKTGGKTPAATIYAAILREITKKGDKSRFRKTDRGMFELAK
jgi:restriction system protein